ncbi:MAG: LLM class flavin-dependent oxidoreductase [Actinomycetales bacterium]|nr:LLM class flavin-dependent oxidoreductase [Actinomycetales bacterium]
MTRFLLRTYAFPDEVERVAVQAEADGWDGLLFQDSQNLTPDITVAMTLAARATERILIGTAVTNLITRNPAVVASTFATLQHLSGGRALLGLARGDTALHLVGERSPHLDEFETLLTRVRGYLAGDEVRIGDVASRLEWLPDPDVPVVPLNVFGSGPRNLRAAATFGDMVTMTLGAEPQQIAWGIEQVRAASPDVPGGALIVGAVGGRRAALRELVRANASITAHFRRDAEGVLSPEDAAVVAQVTRDYDDAAHATAAAAQAHDLTDDFIDRFCVIGTPDECIERLRTLIDLGLDHVVIVGAGRDADPAVAEASERLFAREVLPALRG